MIGGLIASVALLLANAFFVAVEFSLITARRTKLEPLAEQGGRRARLALGASHELSLELAGAQLGVTMASLGLGFVTEPLISGLIERTLDLGHHLPSGLVHTLGFLIGLALVSVAHMVIGEMVPKNVAIADPERTLLWLALPTRLHGGVPADRARPQRHGQPRGPGVRRGASRRARGGALGGRARSAGGRLRATRACSTSSSTSCSPARWASAGARCAT